MLIGDDFYLREFWLLHTNRRFAGTAFGPIPVTVIEDRAERRHDFDGQILDLFVEVVRAMDGAFLQWQAEQFDREQRSQRTK